MGNNISSSAPEVELFAYFYNEEILLHKGPNSAAETPERLSKIVPIMQKHPHFHRVPYKVNENIMSLIRKVHSDEYIETLVDLMHALESHDSAWGCEKCCYINKSGTDRCEMCYSEPPIRNKWVYFDYIDGDTTYFNLHTLASSMIAAMCAVNMAERLSTAKLKYGFAVVRPPGHHAGRETAEGFCIMNNTAIAAEAALKAGLEKVFIFDWDLHHGNGIQNQFYGRSDVFYASIHAKGIYPGTGSEDEIGEGSGRGYNLNIPLAKGTKTEEYLRHFEQKIIPAITLYNPDVILIAAGFDALKTDPMGIFKLKPRTYGAMLEQIVTAFPTKPLGLILEGGYSSDNIATCIELCANVLQRDRD